jgi:hypothetical protein
MNDQVSLDVDDRHDQHACTPEPASSRYGAGCCSCPIALEEA